MKTLKKGCKNKLEINIDNHLIEKKIYKENIEETDIEISLKKINKNWKNISFGDIEVKKSSFHKSKHLIHINNVNFSKIVISNKVSYGKNGFKYLLDTKMIRLNHCV